MDKPNNAPALLALIAEQQATIITLRNELQTAKERAEQYRNWWLEEQEQTKALTAKMNDNA